MAAGADRLELDVHATKDGHIVVFHDTTVDRTTDGNGAVCEHTLAELQGLDAGFRFRDGDGALVHRGAGVRVPTLADVLEEFPEVPLNIEIKQNRPSIEENLVAVLDRYGARPRVLLAGHEREPLERVRALAPDIVTSHCAEEVATFVDVVHSGPPRGYRPPGVALQIPSQYEGTEICSLRLVETAHDFGLEVHVWTINDPATMHRLLDLGVDGLMSDFPERIVAVLQQRGQR